MTFYNFFSLPQWAVFWEFFLLLVFFLYKKAIGYKSFNSFSIFIPLLFTTHGIFVPLSLELNKNFSYWHEYILSLILMYLTILLGIYISNFFIRRKYLLNNQVNIGRADFRFGFAAYFIFIVLLCSFYIFKIYYDGIQFDFLSYFMGRMDAQSYTNHRYQFPEYTSNNSYYLYDKVNYALSPFLLLLVINTKKIHWIIKSLFTLILCFCILHTGHKMPLIMIFSYIFFSRIICSKNFHFGFNEKMKGFLILLSIAVLVIPSFYLLQGSNDYLDALFWGCSRVFLEPERTLQLYFEVYPNYHDFLYGKSTSFIASVFDPAAYFFSPSRYIAEVFLNLKNTSFPSLFIGEAWADFGYSGVVASSLIVGFYFQCVNIWFFNKGAIKTYESSMLILATSFGAYHLIESNLLTAFWNYGLVFNIIIYNLIIMSPRLKKP